MTAAQRFEAHREEIYRWALSILGSHDDALDAVQDVFIRWIVQAKRAVPENPRGWLRRVTVNRAIDLVRARHPSRANTEEPGYRDRPAAELKELRADVTEALDSLSRAQRTVLMAKEFDDLSFAEIAKEMGIALPTVKTHYLRALKSMKPRLTGRWDLKRS